MFFTHVARIIAVLGLLLGLISILMGLAIAQELMGPYEAAAARYGRSGPMIDREFTPCWVP